MRSELWAAAAAIALTCTACSKETAKAPPAPVEAVSAPAIAEAPAPVAAPVAAPEPAAPAEETAVTPAAAPVPTARPERVITVVPAKERRIRGLLANAMARDTTGESEHDAAEAAARRAACRTQACVDRSYAAQEASLRKWVGSEDIH